MKRTMTTPEFANYPGDWHLSGTISSLDGDWGY